MRQIARIVLETGGDAPPATAAHVTLAGDRLRLRGLPAVAPGVGGVMPGTNPLAALLAKESRAGR